MAKILIVDGSEYSRSLLRGYLEAAGKSHQLLEEESGVGAMSCIEANPDIDLIVVNPILPKMDGMTMVEKLNRNSAAKRAPVVMVSNEPNELLKSRARSLGVRAWLVKPCSRDHLLTAVAHVLKPAA